MTLFFPTLDAFIAPTDDMNVKRETAPLKKNDIPYWPLEASYDE